MSYVLVTLRRRYKVAFSNFFFTFQPRPSQPRDKNPWNSSEYLSVYTDLCEHLPPEDFRLRCRQLKMISKSQAVALQHIAIPTTHNEKLLSIIENSGLKGYAKLRDIVRDLSEQVQILEDLFTKMDSVGCDP